MFSVFFSCFFVSSAQESWKKSSRKHNKCLLFIFLLLLIIMMEPVDGNKFTPKIFKSLDPGAPHAVAGGRAWKISVLLGTGCLWRWALLSACRVKQLLLRRDSRWSPRDGLETLLKLSQSEPEVTKKNWNAENPQPPPWQEQPLSLRAGGEHYTDHPAGLLQLSLTIITGKSSFVHLTSSLSVIWYEESSAKMGPHFG